MPNVPAETHCVCCGLSQVGFETEGTAIFDTMQYVTNEVCCLAWTCILRGSCELAMLACCASCLAALHTLLECTLLMLDSRQLC